MFKISVVVPVYNVEKYLRQCIDSLISQTYENYEIILVDDGSKDSSGAICDEYADKYDFIKVIHKENAGLGFARNSGMEIASGEYVTFIDSDDYADEDLIQNLADGLINNNADTCIGGFQKIDDSGKILFNESYKSETFEGKDVKGNFLLRLLGSYPRKHDSFRMSVWNAIYSMDIIRKNNLKFPSERVLISEDIVFDLLYYRYSKKVAVTDSMSYKYRENPNSLTLSYKPGKIDKVNYFYVQMVKMINDTYKNPSEAIKRLQTTYMIKLRGCIAQEKIKRSHNDSKTVKKNIRNICSQKKVQKIVREYDKNKLELKQKLFVTLIKYKLVPLIYILGERDVFN